jgi:hypothetical protein
VNFRHAIILLQLYVTKAPHLNCSFKDSVFRTRSPASYWIRVHFRGMVPVHFRKKYLNIWYLVYETMSQSGDYKQKYRLDVQNVLNLAETMLNNIVIHYIKLYPHINIVSYGPIWSKKKFTSFLIQAAHAKLHLNLPNSFGTETCGQPDEYDFPLSILHFMHCI